MGFHVPPGGSGHGPPFAPQNPTGSINVYIFICIGNYYIYLCIVIKSFFTLAPQPTFQGQQGFQNPPGQQMSYPPHQNQGAYPQPGYAPGAPYGQQPYAQPGSGLNTYPDQSGNNTNEYAVVFNGFMN